MGRLTSRIVSGDWNSVAHAIARLDAKLNTDSTPIFSSLSLTDLTENALMYVDGDGVLTSLAVATSGQLIIGSTGATPSVAALTGTANQIVVTPGAGSITLSLDAAITGHLHDGHTLQHDAVNSNGGAFGFTTTGTVTFNQSIVSANYTAANLLTACATNAGALDFSSSSLTLTVAGTATINAGTHLDHALTLDDDLVVWLRMDDVDGSGVPQDLGSEGMTWIKNNQAAQIDAGVIGKAFTFDGTGDFLNVASPSGLPTGNDARTIVARIRTTSATTQIILSYGTEAAGQKFAFAVLSIGKLLIGVDGGNAIGNTDVADGKWHTVAVSIADGDAIEDAILYVDGVDDGTSSTAAKPINTTQAGLYVGTDLGGIGNPFNGDIDDVRTYSRKLTNPEQLEIHELGTLDAVTAFSAAYFKEYIASRAAFFNRLVALEGDIKVGQLEVTGGLDIDINASDLVGTGDILPEDDITQDLGSVFLAWNNLFIENVFIEPDGAIRVSGGISLIFDNSNGFFEFAGGKVGIGTTDNMLAPLNITGDTAGINDRHEGLWMRSKVGAWIVQLNVRGPRLEIGGGASLDTTPAMSVNYNTGRVGIGTTTPGYILDIDAGEIGDNNYDGLRIIDTGWKAVSHPMLEFYNSHVDFNGSLARIYGEIGDAGTNSKLYFAVADSSKSLQDRMVIDKDGKVGIKTTTPDATLQVVGDARFGDDATNQTRFADDGLQTMTGAARVMISIDLEPSLATRPATGAPDEGKEPANSFVTHDFDDTNDESVYFHLELPHDYADAGTIHVHFDFFVDVAEVGAASVVWGVEYKKLSIGDNFSFTLGAETIGYTQTDVTLGTPANDKKVHRSAEINLTTTGFVAGDYILMRLFRDANGTGGADTFPRDARVIDYHIEYLSDKLGEAT